MGKGTGGQDGGMGAGQIMAERGSGSQPTQPLSPQMPAHHQDMAVTTATVILRDVVRYARQLATDLGDIHDMLAVGQRVKTSEIAAAVTSARDISAWLDTALSKMTAVGLPPGQLGSGSDGGGVAGPRPSGPATPPPSLPRSKPRSTP